MFAMAAALGTGIFIGWLLTQIYATAAISRAQQRMQRKVRYWQAQTARAREEAAGLARRMAARGPLTDADSRRQR
jgi:hypothetical protein